MVLARQLDASLTSEIVALEPSLDPGDTLLRT
jgi:hypothetical protein